MIKNKKNIYMINLPSPHEVLIPYTSSVVTSLARQDNRVLDNYTFKPYLFDFQNCDVKDIIEHIINPGVIGISLYLWNYKKSLKLAKLVKEKYPKCIIILGGPSVPDDSKSLLIENTFIDFIVHGEGEISFKNILLYLEDFLEMKDLSSVSFRLKDKIFSFKEKFTDKVDMQNIPSPYLSGDLDDYIQLFIKAGRDVIVAWETNRGCPYNCSFCNWGSYTNSKIRGKKRDTLFSEVSFFAKKVNVIHICDANFGILPIDYELAESIALLSKNKRLKNLQVSYAKNSKNRVLKIAKIFEKYGLSRFGATLSMQSVDTEVLFNIDRSNIKIQQYINFQKEANLLGISSYVELILGLPGETKLSFLNGIETLLDANITDLRVYRLSLLPNTNINKPEIKTKYNISTIQWINSPSRIPDEVEYTEVVNSTQSMSSKDIEVIDKIVKLVTVLHFGKWSWYIVKYLKDFHKINYVQFYEYLVDNCIEGGIISSVCNQDFLKKYNNGNHQTFEGNNPTFNINWSNRLFKKETFLWLGVNYFKKEFYKEITEILYKLIDDERLVSLIKFQKNLMISSNIHVSLNEPTYKYNWLSYFRKNTDLLEKNYKITDEKNMNYKNKDDFLFEKAGGSFFLKKNNFTKNVTEMKEYEL